MLQISQSSDYAIQGLIYLASRQGDEPIAVDEVARARGVPKHYLSKIFQLLMRHGLVSSYRGTGGGYILSRPAEEITLRQVLEAVEGPLVVSQCVVPVGCQRCEHAESCSVKDFWHGIRTILLEMLEGATIGDMLQEKAAPGEAQDSVQEDEAVA